MRWPRALPAQAAPLSARLFASVPPEVTTISRGSAFRPLARRSWASSSAARATRPYECAELAFPNDSVRNGSIASRTSRRSGRRGRVIQVDRHRADRTPLGGWRPPDRRPPARRPRQAGVGCVLVLRSSSLSPRRASPAITTPAAIPRIEGDDRRQGPQGQRAVDDRERRDAEPGQDAAGDRRGRVPPHAAGKPRGPEERQAEAEPERDGPDRIAGQLEPATARARAATPGQRPGDVVQAGDPERRVLADADRAAARPVVLGVVIAARERGRDVEHADAPGVVLHLDLRRALVRDRAVPVDEERVLLGGVVRAAGDRVERAAIGRRARRPAACSSSAGRPPPGRPRPAGSARPSRPTRAGLVASDTPPLDPRAGSGRRADSRHRGRYHPATWAGTQVAPSTFVHAGPDDDRWPSATGREHDGIAFA